jgi:hypothetical protein
MLATHALNPDTPEKPLTDEQRQTLREWKVHFKRKYLHIGNLTK